jgi:hypothetical protein
LKKQAWEGGENLKNNINFFTHEVCASEHRKFLILRTYYGEGDKGWAMEGRFWRLNSLIGKADECKIDLNLKGEKARIAHDLGLGLKELDEFLTVLEVESELINSDNGVIWTDQTQEDLERAMSSRKSQKDRRNRALPNETETLPNKPENNANKNDGVDRSRVDKIGVEHTQDARAPEAPISKNPTEYPKLIHDRWTKLVGVPQPPEYMTWIQTQGFRDVMASLKGYHSSDVLGALDNFGQVIADPDRYWIKARPSMASFFRGEIFQACRPEVFPGSALKDGEGARAETTDEKIARLRREGAL